MKANRVIICVDDEKIILDSLNSQLLRNLGTEFVYEFAESASEAKRLIDDLDREGLLIHTVISDWLMPEIKGDEFLYWVAEHYTAANRILLTGHMEDSLVEDIDCCSAKDIKCLYKPWKEEDLLDLVNSKTADNG